VRIPRTGVTSTDRLLEALEMEADQGKSIPLEIIRKAQTHYYHDYLSPIAMNMIALYHDARAAGLEIVASGAVSGLFDATKEEADAWAASPEGQATFAEFGIVPPNTQN